MRLFLPYGPPTEATRLDWLCLDTGKQGCSPLAELSVSNVLELILPANSCLLCEVDLPPKSQRQLERLLPYALEDKLLCEPEQLHFAAKAIGKSDRYAVVAVERAWLAAWLNAFKTRKLPVRTAWPLQSLLPAPAAGHVDAWQCEENLWLIQTAQEQLLEEADDSPLPPGVLNHMRQHPQDQLVLYSAKPVVVAKEAPAYRQEPSAVLHARAARGDYPNLLQGKFAVGPHWQIDWRPFRGSAILLALLLLTALLHTLGQGWQAQAEKSSLLQQMNRLLQQAAPNTPVIDARLQLQALLKERLGNSSPVATTGADALATLNTLAPLLQNSALRLIRLSNSPEGTQVDYQVGNAEQAATILSQLRSRGLKTEMLSSSTTEARFLIGRP